MAIERHHRGHRKVMEPDIPVCLEKVPPAVTAGVHVTNRDVTTAERAHISTDTTSTLRREAPATSQHQFSQQTRVFDAELAEIHSSA